MANTLDLMDLKQILTLHLDGLSSRKIGDMLGIHRNTINRYVQLFNASKYTKEELLAKDNEELLKLFPSHTTIKNPRYDELMRYFEKMNQQLDHPGFTFLFHYNEYRLQSQEPYSYTQFMEHYHRKFPKEKGSMKLEHKAGHEVYIDFTGKKLQIINRETGEIIPVEVFVAILPKSQYTYAEACLSQKREDLISCLANALSYYGGAPKAIVSDNLKSALTRASKYEPEINRSFKDFARHYNCVTNPTRGYSPQDKALVENAVNLVYQRIFYPLRQMSFFSLEELNREIRRLLGPYNNLLLQHRQASRRELFQSIEREYLKPLPETAYELKDYRRAKVQKTGYVYFSPDKNYYSVPYRYIGKRTQIQYTKSTVEVCYNHERIASHKRNPAPGVYTTNENHLSSTHKAYQQWSPDYFKKKASRHGVYVLSLIEDLLKESDYPEMAYKRAMGIIQLHRDYSSERLNNACKIALDVETYSYKRIKNILKNNQDKDFEPLEDATQTHIPYHSNIRGASAYK
ncbi:IS21 family transposase [Marinilabilia rubra]|uniref:IS21 family transposase n=1 Tax=Marinilabilia rubra TaxID=2162893 RepID=A0A2U2B5A8_9BACT|nr:IS21 family transposase [Marinilabilia rubra]PWD98236.1 IS21 family transposase [Marinilabilia rubra]